MKKVLSFLVALILFLGTASGIHHFIDKKVRFDPHAFGSWISQYKFFAGDEIKSNMDQNSILVLGSSEFRHGTGMSTHPAKLFKNHEISLMMVGAGYYQSLFHSVELAALEDGIKNRKVVLILSPQWFTREGVLAPAYASRFSETNFISMINNPHLSGQTKEYIIKRSKELLMGDPQTLERVKKYERVFLKGNASLADKKYVDLYRGFLEEKSRISIYTAATVKHVEKFDPEKKGNTGEPDWEALREIAENEARVAAGGNPFYMSDRIYQKKILPQLEEKKDSSVNASYGISPEYQDLECFLQVCREAGIRPMLVMMPVNGYWYDHIGFPKTERQKYYENIRSIAEKYDAVLADFAEDEYTRYFFLDKVHLGWKGWLAVDESIYRFAAETEKQ